MNTIKLGILNCSNMTRILDCCTGACLKDMYDHKGAFSRYKNQNAKLVGISSCNGCPTVAGPETISARAESLIHYGARRIHISYCMLVLCPFIRKYLSILNETFPGIEFIRGTHEPHRTNDRFRCDIKEMLKERRKVIIP
ncbi:MAG: CGGC domain-containing protein [Planctomycetota bacterium]